MRTAQRRPPTPGPGFDVYWQFAAARQDVYRKRLDGLTGAALTTDPVLGNYRFTNAYRASDRVSQYLITNVIYDKARDWPETFARVLVFKLFNRVETWEHLRSSVGEVGTAALMSGALDEALAALPPKKPIYNAAYIMPPPRSGTGPKFRRHLSLLRRMLRDRADQRIAESPSMSEAFDVLTSYESIGPFLAFQYLIDLNYTPHLNFSEADYVVAGPGALRGIRKCFRDLGDYTPADTIKWVAEQQEEAFRKRDLAWLDLWGRPLQLIDAQNLFCEVDKYTREAHPELSALAAGSRIKQRYTPAGPPPTAWFPPKWGVNDSIPARYHSTDGESRDQLTLFGLHNSERLSVEVSLNPAAASLA